jgi:putative addiction module component (TIGR02574 family)
MSRSLTELVEEALALPSESRAYLAERLLETLDAEENFVVSQAWRNEVRKRCQELDERKVQSIPAETAIAELRKSLA